MTNLSHSDSTLFSKELNVLLSIMKMKIGNNDLSTYRDCLREINWGEFLQLARHHRVYPNLYAKLKQAGENHVPPQVLRELQQDYQNNTFTMLHLSAEMANIAKVFSDSDIRAIMLKGPVLAVDLYGDISLRTSGDLDVLIPIQSLQQTEDLLCRLGYVKDDEYKTILNDWKWRHHHVTYNHFQKGIKLEIHWRLSPGPGKEPTFNELWERKRISPIAIHPIYYLGREDLFLFLASHGARHGWSRLRWLADIDQLARQELDDSKLQDLLKKHQQLHIGAQAIILAVRILHTPLTPGLETLASVKRADRLAEAAYFYIRQKINLHTFPVPPHVSSYHKRHLFALMATRQKMLFVLSFLHPYPEDAETLRLPESLHVLYFLLRPFLWAWRKTRKNVVSQGEL
ncbi:nucleotidyltransferase domain-containing protein [Paenibacillus alba]|uniref:Nucleotidyltransferase family protein n=1 Tax=Paenibacillus alba TaxID=1197127 RepID=A0ABU6G1H9_9BACL|nr:nucleotidyltransferase family protein [Paenibacillus alba]MEC0228011.1 nucleotidyltransferase family protein [Paenibacillus alba]